MQKIIWSLIFTGFFILQGCSCNCDTIPVTNPDYTQINSKVIVFGDACGSLDGSVNLDGYSNANCDAEGGYVNRGYWVKAPNASTFNSSTTTIAVYDSIYTCSFGNDNTFSERPYIKVTPNGGIVSNFTFTPTISSQTIKVKPGQIVVLDVNNSNTANIGFGISQQNLSSLPVCGTGDYQSFITNVNKNNPINTGSKSLCQGQKGFGLTVHVGSTEIITFDQANSYPGMVSNYYKQAQFRTMNLFATLPASSLNNFFTDAYTRNAYQYGPYSTGYGAGRYILIIPDGVIGTLGFSIAQNHKVSGTGQYAVQVYTTPSECFVNQAKVTSSSSRGALGVYIGTNNPNLTESSLINNVNITKLTSIRFEYYPKLTSFLSGQSNFSIISQIFPLSAKTYPSLVQPTMVISDCTNKSDCIKTVDQSLPAGQMWFKVLDDYYHDNVGQYQVYINILTKKSSIVSQLINAITEPISSMLANTTGIIYNSITQNIYFRMIIKLSLILYLVLFGIQYTLALTEVSASNFVIRVIKIGVVNELFSQNNWDFFNQYLFNIFNQGSVYLVSSITGDYNSNRTGIFGFADTVYNQFFSSDTWRRIAALCFDLIGFLCVIILSIIMVTYCKVLFKALISFLFVLIGFAVLISIAPIFIVMILFNRTKKYFDNWIKYLADYALQPVIMFGTLYVLNAIFMTLWNNALGFGICWGGVIEIIIDMSWLSFNTPLGSFTIPSFKLGCLQYYNIIGGMQPFLMLSQFLILYLITVAIRALIEHVPSITSAITGVGSASVAIDNLSKDVGYDALKTGLNALPVSSDTKRQIVKRSKLSTGTKKVLNDYLPSKEPIQRESSSNSDKNQSGSVVSFKEKMKKIITKKLLG